MFLEARNTKTVGYRCRCFILLKAISTQLTHQFLTQSRNCSALILPLILLFHSVLSPVVSFCFPFNLFWFHKLKSLGLMQNIKYQVKVRLRNKYQVMVSTVLNTCPLISGFHKYEMVRYFQLTGLHIQPHGTLKEKTFFCSLFIKMCKHQLCTGDYVQLG